MLDYHYHSKEFTFFIRPASTDILIVKEVVERGQYFNKEGMEIKKDNIVIDIGAHIGAFSVLAAGLGANVFSYEPAQDSFDLLVKNIEYNGFSEQIKVYKNGVMGSSGKRTLGIRMGNFGGSNLYNKSPVSEKVDCITLDQVFKDNNITHCDFLKLDCEGAEYEIIKDFPLDKIDRIAVEYVGKKRRKELIRLLSKYYFLSEVKNEQMGIIYAL